MTTTPNPSYEIGEAVEALPLKGTEGWLPATVIATTLVGKRTPGYVYTVRFADGRERPQPGAFIRKVQP